MTTVKWSRRAIGEVLKVRYGKALPKSERDKQGAYPVVGSAGRMTGTATPLVSEPALIIGRKGNAGQVQLEAFGCWPIDTTYYAAVPAEMDARFLRWQLHALNLGGLDSSTATPSLRREDLEAQELMVPPLEEQRRIVAILEDHLSRLDAADASAHQAVRRSRALTVSSMGTAIRAAASEAPIETIGEHAVRVEYGTSAKCHEVANEGDVPVLRMGNIQDGRVDLSKLKYLPAGHQDLERLTLRRGDLVFNRTNSAELVGKTAVFEEDSPASFASYLIRVRMGPTVHPAWASMAINSPQGRGYISTCVTQQVGQANVNGTKLKAFPLPVPPIERQRELVSRHRETVESADRLVQTATVTLARSAALRRSLLAAAFSGRLTGSRTEMSVV